MRPFATQVVLCAGALLAACGGGSGSAGDTGAAGLSARVTVLAEAPGAHCTAGGSRIVAGADSNGDGVLQDAEVGSTQYVCNAAPGLVGAAGATGAAGNDGLATLVTMVDEPAGDNCPSGGKRLQAAKDTNADGILQASEVTSTSYVCNGDPGMAGAAGAPGATGSSGTNSLVSVTPEAAGSNCSHGGHKVSSGEDSNRNAMLDRSEVSSISYLCDGAPGAAGATGATGAAGPGLSWVDVSTASVMAQANIGYLADSASRVTVTLPTTLAVGDIVRVSGIGGGGWTIAQQAGQSIATAGIATTAIGATWTSVSASHGWETIAASADGVRLVSGAGGGQLYTSTDAGVSWTPREAARNWQAVASSDDGLFLAAAVIGGRIYTSTDAGLNWTARDSNRPWSGIASSDDGIRLVASVQGGQLYTSTDAGASWTARDVNRDWRKVASSADGVRLVAAEWNGNLYTSADAGVTWTPRDAVRRWTAIASSADGNRLVAAENNGQLYVSQDAGVTWRPRGPTLYWQAVTSSSDGKRLVAIADRFYVSIDYGLTWTARGPTGFWGSLAASDDATRLYASPQDTSLYRSLAGTTLGASGSISGGQYEAVELQYVGAGAFAVLSYVGALVVN